MSILKIIISVFLFLLLNKHVYRFIFKRKKLKSFIKIIIYTFIFAIFLNFSNITNNISIPNLKKATLPEGFVYYNQTDEAWGNEYYGTSDLIRDAGCGPTVTAMIVSTLTDTKINPKEMADWSYNNGYYSSGSGSYHTLIGDSLNNFGLSYTTTNDIYDVKTALQEGKYVVALMGNGHFTSSGHFIILCSIDNSEKVTVADPNSIKNTEKLWDFNTITSETKYSSTINGSYWIIDKN